MGIVAGLGLPQSKRDEVKSSCYHSPAKRRDAYIDIYVNDHPFPTWTQVSQALRNVYLFHEANVVDSTYVQGTVLWSSTIFQLHVCQYLVCAPIMLCIMS